MRLKSLFCVLILAAACAAQAAAPAVVPVGNPGNAADTTGFGAVPYEFSIGVGEVTNDEYCEFLNAVAKKDPHELYDDRMAATTTARARPGAASPVAATTAPSPTRSWKARASSRSATSPG